MKKIFFIIATIVVIMSFSVAFATCAEYKTLSNTLQYIQPSELYNQICNLPASLEMIEEGAFESTSITKIVLPETVTTIGERAFANIVTLRSIIIPKATTIIAKTAFAGSDNVAINAAPNSFAREWAKENRILFTILMVMYARPEEQNVKGILTTTPNEVLDTGTSETQESNRAWKKLEESQVCDIIKILANVIKGRAPPMA